MNEHYICTDRAVVFGLWAIVMGLALTTCAEAIWGNLGAQWVGLAVVVLLPLTGLTVILQARLYVLRLCSVIRATAGIQRSDGELRAVR